MKFQSYDSTISDLSSLKDELNSDSHIFILVYMDGCEPCNRTKPSWKNLNPTLSDQYNKRDDISVIDVERNHLPQLKEVGDVEGFPTIKYMNKKKGVMENYDNERSTDAFIKWIESKIDHVNVPETISKIQESIQKKKGKSNKVQRGNGRSNTRSKGRSKRKSNIKTKKKSNTKTKKKRKWSLKYKKSIDCKHPKGFSQKQHCKYGRKK